MVMSIFRLLNASINKETVALWMDGDAMVGWLHTKHAGEVKEDMVKTETHTCQNRSEAAH